MTTNTYDHVVITGATRGLGRAVLDQVAPKARALTLTYKTNAALADVLVRELQASGVDAAAVQLDLADLSSVARAASDISSRGAVSALINNAGEIPRPGDWQKISDDDLQRTVSANLTGHLSLISKLSPAISPGGSIVNIVSTYALVGAGAVLAYTAAKAGMITATRAYARELGARGIRVNAIAPGNFDTAMAAEAGAGFVAWVEETAALGRLGRPDEVGAAVEYLLSAEYVTGIVLPLDGGQLLNI